MELFPLVSCIARKLRSELSFSRFCGPFIGAQKLKQEPALAYDMGNSEELIDYKGPWEHLRLLFYLLCWKCSFAASLFMTNISHNASMWGALTSSPCHTSKAAKMTADSSILSHNADGAKSEQFFGEKWGIWLYARKKKLKTLLCMV